MTQIVDAPSGTASVRRLTPRDAADLVRLTREDPRANLFVRHRVEETGLRDVLLGGSVLGVYRDDRLVSACHVGANLVTVEAGDDDVDLFAQHVLSTGVRSASVVGPRDAVLRLWGHLEPHWGPARSPRTDQPLLAIDHDPAVAPDPRVRRALINELDLVHPAAVAMFREEVGVDPEAGGGVGYRARVSQLIARGWSFVLVEDGRVIFKTEVGAAADGVCQLQGVWVHPDLRGRGIAAPALAAVVQQVRADVAADVTLYVNAFNTAARAAYDRVGFTQVGTFASILL